MGKKRKASDAAREEQKRRKQGNPDHEYEEPTRELVKEGPVVEKGDGNSTVMRSLQNRDKSSGACVCPITEKSRLFFFFF